MGLPKPLKTYRRVAAALDESGMQTYALPDGATTVEIAGVGDRIRELCDHIAELEEQRDELEGALRQRTECTWVGCDGGCIGCQAAELLSRLAPPRGDKEQKR